ncbi:MAG TPA: MlaD family protein [Opitutaceae bacterium]|jgi:paraquat-inducible protein B
MKTRVSPAVIGAFVLGAFVIGLITLLAVGSLTLFTKPERFIVYFDESISGLDAGSTVKLRGVRVGHVVNTSIRYDRTTDRSLAAVVCELDRGTIVDEHGDNLDFSSRDALEDFVHRGLRAQLELSGLATGLLYIELDILDPKKYPDRSPKTETKYVVVPQTPSEISELRAGLANLMANSTVLLAKFEQVDFKELSKQLIGLSAEARGRLEGVDLKGLADQWKRTGESIDVLARSPEAREMAANLNKTLNALSASIGHLDTQVNANGKQLQETLVQAKTALESFNAAAQTARGFISEQQNFGQETTRALDRVAEAAEAVRQLADFLERNPNAILAGRKEPR